jgi:hypothetical protein
MCNDLSSGFKDSVPTADSGLKVRMSSEHPEQVSSIVDRKRQFSEPERIGEILPGLMADIEKRLNSQPCEQNKSAVSY